MASTTLPGVTGSVGEPDAGTTTGAVVEAVWVEAEEFDADRWLDDARTLVEDVAAQAGLPAPVVCHGNVNGVGASIEVHFVDQPRIHLHGGTHCLPEDQLRALVAHELGHLAHPGDSGRVLSLRLGSLASILSALVLTGTSPLLVRPLADACGPVAALGSVLALIATSLIPHAVFTTWQRRRELEADDYARRLGHGPALGRYFARTRPEASNAPLTRDGYPAFTPTLWALRLAHLGALLSTHPAYLERLIALKAADQACAPGSTPRTSGRSGRTRSFRS